MSGVSVLTICILLGANGFFYGKTDLFVAQIISTGVAVIFAVVGSAMLYKVVSVIVEIRTGTPNFFLFPSPSLIKS